jgi:3-phenylpropionate/trans-cinnamate dioxygenase ferredoxin reductase component
VARKSIAVVGASLAGLHAARTLRHEGYQHRIVLIGDEPHRPYDRPPLSKELLRREWTSEQTALAYDDAELGAEWRLGRRAIDFSVDDLTIAFDDGTREGFDGVVIATGAKPRRLSGDEMRGVHVLRTLDDSLALAEDLAAIPARVVVVGAGFIGAEVASTCRALGLNVTIVEALDLPLQRILGPELGKVFADLHHAHGVDLRLGVTVGRIEGQQRVQRVHLSDGDVLDADVVVVGIGVNPSTDWLVGSGLNIDDGVLCDATCLAAPGVVAAGDVARWPNARFDELRRVEHWDNAIRQGEHAARRLLAREGTATRAVYDPIPWFWTHLYGLKMQLLGSPQPYDEVEIVSGSVESNRFLALFRRGNQLTAAFGVKAAREMITCRQLLERRSTWVEALKQFRTTA